MNDHLTLYTILARKDLQMVKKWTPRWKTDIYSNNLVATFSISYVVYRPAAEWLANETKWSVTRAARWLRNQFDEICNPRMACVGAIIAVCDSGTPGIQSSEDPRSDTDRIYEGPIMAMATLLDVDP